METIRVDARRVERPTTDLETDIKRVETLAKLMDAQFEISGVKFGLDSLIGLVPVAGDAISFMIGLFPIMVARKHGLGKIVVARMLMNLGVDFLAGAVPVVGDALDVVIKANLKNLQLLKNAAESKRK